MADDFTLVRSKKHTGPKNHSQYYKKTNDSHFFKGRKTNSTKYTNSVVTSIFSSIDERQQTLENDPNYDKYINAYPDPKIMDSLIKEVCELFEIQNPEEEKWFIEIEAVSIYRDRLCIKDNKKPIFSDTLSQQIIIVKPCKAESLPNTYAVVISRHDKNEKIEDIFIDSFNTKNGFNDFIKNNKCNLNSPFNTDDNVQKSNSLLYSCINTNDEKRRGEIIENYNSIQPIWSFVKVPKDFKRNKIDFHHVPCPDEYKNTSEYGFRDINYIPLILRENEGTKIAINENFEGFIPTIIENFINGSLHDDIMTINFHRTLLLWNNLVYRGYHMKFYIRPKNTDKSNIVNFMNNLKLQMEEQRDYIINSIVDGNALVKIKPRPHIVKLLGNEYNKVKNTKNYYRKNNSYSKK